MKAGQWPAPRPPGAEPLPPMPRPAPPPHVACSSPCLGFGVVVRQVPTRAVIVPVPKKRRGPPTAWTGRDGLPNQKRTPPVMMNVLPPPTSPRASANGVSLLPFNLNVVPPSRFSPALVSEMLVPPDGPADACAMFKPPPAYGRQLRRAGSANRYATVPVISV